MERDRLSKRDAKRLDRLIFVLIGLVMMLLIAKLAWATVTCYPVGHGLYLCGGKVVTADKVREV